MEPELDQPMDISKMKVPDLKRELKSRGLSTSGNKIELVERLQNVLKTKMDDTVGESVDDLEEDLLNDDDDASVEHLDGSESGITDIDSSVEITATQKGKRKLTELGQGTKPAKKVILNRTSSITENLTQDSISQNDLSVEEKNEKKVVKLSTLSAKERLEMRAKKFGIELTDDAKKMARAERFGSTDNKISSVISNPDVLKQRAARFGLPATSAISNLDNEERKKRRQERFGASTNGSPQNDKMQKRLDRFKQTVK